MWFGGNDDWVWLRAIAEELAALRDAVESQRFDLLGWGGSLLATMLGVIVGGLISAWIAARLYERERTDAASDAARAARFSSVSEMIAALTQVDAAFGESTNRDAMDAANLRLTQAGLLIEASGAPGVRQVLLFVGTRVHAIRANAKSQRRSLRNQALEEAQQVLFAWRDDPGRVARMLQEELQRTDTELSDDALRRLIRG